MKFVLNFILIFIILPNSFAVGFLKHQVKRILKLDKNYKYDKRKCISKPEFLYGHFLNDSVYPDEIHTFYINTKSPRSRYTIGHDLKPVVRRVLSVDRKYKKHYDSFTILKIKACIANENYLKSSYLEEGALMGLESNPNHHLKRRENLHYEPYRR